MQPRSVTWAGLSHGSLITLSIQGNLLATLAPFWEAGNSPWRWQRMTAQLLPRFHPAPGGLEACVISVILFTWMQQPLPRLWSPCLGAAASAWCFHHAATFRTWHRKRAYLSSRLRLVERSAWDGSHGLLGSSLCLGAVRACFV